MGRFVLIGVFKRCSCRGIIIVIGVAIGKTGQKIMDSRFPVPCKLPKSYFLVGHIGSVPVHTVLVMAVEAELEHYPVLKRQLIVPKKLPSTGIDTLAIYFIASPVFSGPIHLASPSVFIYITSYQGK